ncbi:hypothetical protein [Haloferula sp.]|uniref:hypothetical protein n=1 Tax=Haloferula sp. TaxID=2497595 RepID=UPI00329A9560
MKVKNESQMCQLAAKIEEAETRLEKLQVEIDEIGQPAAQDLERRLNALKVEERALKRNFAETQVGKGDNEARLAKVETLLRHIENEESSVEHAAAFLHQGNPSTVVLAAEAGAKIVGAIGRGAKKVFGDHPFEQSSVFVNHSHETLVSRYGLKKEGTQRSSSRE